MLHSLKLCLVQTLLLFPRAFHLGFDLLKLSLHFIAAALVIALEASVFVALCMQVLLHLLHHFVLVQSLGFELTHLPLKQSNLLLE